MVVALSSVVGVNMLRYFPLIALSLAACNSGMISPDEPDTGSDMDAGMMPDAMMPPPDSGSGDGPRDQFDSQVHPLLVAECSVCHEPGGSARYAFVNTATDDYNAAFGLAGFVNVRSPEDSRLLAKGEHDGPAWSPTEYETIRSWIEAEGADRPVELVIPKEPPTYGFTNHDLGPLGATGAALNYTLEEYDTGLRLRNVTLAAGPQGLLVELPTIEIYDGESIDRTVVLYEEELRIDPNDTFNLGDFLVPDFPSGGEVGVRFLTLRTVVGGGPDPTVSCRNVEAFTTQAQPEMAAFCVRCHTTEPDAIARMDLQLIGDTFDPDAMQESCDEVLQWINRAYPAESDLFRNPDPRLQAETAHPFVFDDVGQLDAFRSQILLWVSVEPL